MASIHHRRMAVTHALDKAQGHGMITSHYHSPKGYIVSLPADQSRVSLCMTLKEAEAFVTGMKVSSYGFRESVEGMSPYPYMNQLMSV